MDYGYLTKDPNKDRRFKSVGARWWDEKFPKYVGNTLGVVFLAAVIGIAAHRHFGNPESGLNKKIDEVLKFDGFVEKDSGFTPESFLRDNPSSRTPGLD